MKFQDWDGIIANEILKGVDGTPSPYNLQHLFTDILRALYNPRLLRTVRLIRYRSDPFGQLSFVFEPCG